MSRFVFSGESADYQQRREELLDAEIALKDQVERVATLRRQLPVGMRVPEYVFREGPLDVSQQDSADFADVRLSDRQLTSPATPVILRGVGCARGGSTLNGGSGARRKTPDASSNFILVSVAHFE